MKTVQEWELEVGHIDGELDNMVSCVAIGHVPKIQLDAFKAGAAWAAEQEVEAYPNAMTHHLHQSIYDDGARDLSKKILKELEKLTEIPK